MVKRSLQLSPLGIQQAKHAFAIKGWTQENLAGEIDLKTRQPVWRFLTGQPVERQVFMGICSTLDLDWREVALDPPTEFPEKEAIAALKINALVAQVRSQQRSPRLHEMPFDARRRMMTVVLDWQSSDLWKTDAANLSVTKGAPVEVLQCCRLILQEGQPQELTAADRDQVTAMNDHLASQGYRVLSIAARQGGKELLDAQNLEHDLTFIGLVAMMAHPALKLQRRSPSVIKLELP